MGSELRGRVESRFGRSTGGLRPAAQRRRGFVGVMTVAVVSVLAVVASACTAVRTDYSPPYTYVPEVQGLVMTAVPVIEVLPAPGSSEPDEVTYASVRRAATVQFADSIGTVRLEKGNLWLDPGERCDFVEYLDEINRPGECVLQIGETSDEITWVRAFSIQYETEGGFVPQVGVIIDVDAENGRVLTRWGDVFTWTGNEPISRDAYLNDVPLSSLDLNSNECAWNPVLDTRSGEIIAAICGREG